ncbi:hypothetical protein C3L33_08686, partial [Rhododendron williamsianum]
MCPWLRRVCALRLGKLEMLGDNMNLEEFDQALKSMVVAYNSSVLNKSESDAANVETFVVDAGQSVYRGGGKRGGPFRGGNFGNRPPRSRGRGRGRGGPRRFPPNDASSSSRPKPYAVEEAELNEEEAVTEPTADNHEETEAQKPGNGAPIKRPPQAAWCELCRVDCTSLEILEQHKNGKKHKKNLQRKEELQNAIKPVTEIQNEQKSVAESNPEIVQEGEDNKKPTLPANSTTEALTNENKVGMERQNDVAEQRRGMKRMMRGGRGGKRLRTDGPRRPMEPPKQPKVVIPLICDLCNVKCDTQEVFDRHLAGKKHISKLKRFEGHQAMYGPVGLQALYPPNPLSQTLFHPQGPQQAFYGTQGSYPPPGPCVPPPQGQHLAQNPSHQVPASSSYYDGQMATPVNQQQPASFGTESNQNGASGSEATGLAQQVIQ